MKEQAEAVQRMQDYIGEHRNETITLADLSRVSLFSPWHSYRLFKQWTGLTPSDYIRRLRLSTSALKLRDGQCRIADVAYEYGFGSVDGYQRAFLREFGCNPREYAANPVPLYLFTPYGVKYREIRKEPRIVENVRNIFIQVIDKPVRKAVIRRGVRAEDYFAYCEEVGATSGGAHQYEVALRGAGLSVAAGENAKARDVDIRSGGGGRSGLQRSGARGI